MTTQPLAIIPARVGSKGVPNKNFRLLPDGHSLTWRAIQCAKASWCYPVLSTNVTTFGNHGSCGVIVEQTGETWDAFPVQRPDALAQDDTPMIDVVRHVLEAIPGPPDQVIVLLQPTSPFRTVAHVTTALELLVEPWTSVVSVVEVPAHSRPGVLCQISDDILRPWPRSDESGSWWGDRFLPSRRQDAEPAFRRDGTVYVFRRRTVVEWDHIYGDRARAYLLPASKSFTIDTLEEWDEAERRVKADNDPDVVLPSTYSVLGPIGRLT